MAQPRRQPSFGENSWLSREDTLPLCKIHGAAAIKIVSNRCEHGIVVKKPPKTDGNTARPREAASKRDMFREPPCKIRVSARLRQICKSMLQVRSKINLFSAKTQIHFHSTVEN